MGLHHGVAAVAVAHGVGELLDADQIAHGLDVGHDGLAALFLGEPVVLAGLGLHAAVLVDDLDELEVVVLAEGPVVVVVAGGHLEGARAELAVHVAVGDDRHLAAADGHDAGLADEVLVALVVGMHADGGVAGYGFGAGGGHDQALVGVLDVVLDLPQMPLLVLVVDLVVGKGGVAARAPVDDVLAPVDQAFPVELHEDLAHGAGEALVHGEAQALPVHGAAHGVDLVQDAAAVLLAPLPDALDELLAAQILAALALLGEGALDHVLGGDAGVVGAGHPEDVASLLAVVAAERVDEGEVERMPYVQGAGHVRRRDDDGVGFARRVRVRSEGLLVPPVGAPFLFDAMRVVALG